MNEQTLQTAIFFEHPHLYLHKRFGVRVRALIAKDLLADRVAGADMLDAGCGDGGVTSQFIGQLRSLHLVDIAANMLQLARQQFQPQDLPKVQFTQSDVSELETLSRYDLIVAFGLIMHVENAAETLAKFYELLQPGGRLLIQVTNARHPFSLFNRFIHRKSAVRVKYFSEPEFLNLLKGAGFRIEKKVTYSWLLSGMGRLPDSWLFRFHLWTYHSGWASKWGMDGVYLLSK